MSDSYIKVRLADGLEIMAKSVTMEMPEPTFLINRNGRRIMGSMNYPPTIILELDDTEILKMVEFFGTLLNFVGKPKLMPAKPGVKRLIDLS